MKNSNPIIRFHLLYPFKFTQRRKTKAAIIALFKKEKKSLAGLNYIFCSDDFLLKINQEYLNHDTLTDILTFDLSDNPDLISGEIYISVERVQENAIRYKIPFSTELSRVMFHGALHLCGYKDKKPAEILKMRAKEDYYLSRS